MAFTIIFAVIGLICLAYYLVLTSYAGFGTSFAMVWLGIVIVLLILTVLSGWMHMKQIRIRPMIRNTLLGTLVTGALVFILVEGMICFAMLSKPGENLDYLIVLGAQVRGIRITSPLQYRLDKAVDYLNDHADTKVVVSGGQGPGEDLTEGKAMAQELIRQGIAKDRIILEEKSTNTEENIRFSMALIDKDWTGDDSPQYGVVTNNFHVYRAVGICKKLGYDVDGISAGVNWKVFPNYMLREFFAVVKYKITGAM